MTTNDYRKFKNRSERRWLGALIGLLVCANALVLGPCNVGDYLYGNVATDTKVDGTIGSYGDSRYWDGTMPGGDRYMQCMLQCF